MSCIHPPGRAQPNTPFRRVTVGGRPVVTQASLYTIANCGLSGTQSPPCATAQYVTGATRVFAGGAPLLLQDSQAFCVPTSTGLRVEATQVRVRGT
ncbi:MAG: hypothetical protein ACR2H9_20465 [Longimicrobiaceae bacterium]